jgi:hypothetical protein
VKAVISGELRRLAADDRGGIHIALFCLMGLAVSAVIAASAVSWMLQSYNVTKTKASLDHALDAASLDINRTEASLGRLVWDSPKGTATFYTYFRKNLRLDSSNMPQPGSYLTQPPIVHHLEFVTSTEYPYLLRRSITVYGDTADEVTRQVEVTIYGPSIVAIVEVRQRLIGQHRSEPIVVSGASNVRFK